MLVSGHVSGHDMNDLQPPAKSNHSGSNDLSVAGKGVRDQTFLDSS
jgi:hypothetical protein